MRSLLLLIFCFGLMTANAQKMSWRKHAKLAEKQYAEGNLLDAAFNYEAAWLKKKKKKEYIFQAAECYFQLKDYRKAAEAYSHIKEENKDFMLPGLKYCRSLKMDGQYDEASRAFVYFINGYQGDDKDIVANIVQDEIRGCELGMTMLENETKNVTFEHLSSNVNSKGADFAPVPFSDDVLYYTSNMVGETKMYLTQRSGGVWSQSRVPKNFPKIDAPHFGNGAFSPDNKTFFYTQCEKIDATGRMIEDCMIYVTQHTESGWSNPQKLNMLINKKGSTTTHPFVVHQDNKEILYFSSNRSGGEGGMDIWFTTRDLGSEKMDFARPQNLGETVNTMADEITPYFDMDENAIYFSSNGKANIGGYDVFKSAMTAENAWDKSTNIGLPYNSNADDYYFRKYSTSGGYIVSNRKFGLEKTTYQDDDIYSFSIPTERMMASGKIIDKNFNQPVQNVSVALYEMSPSGSIKLLENKVFPTGDYQFGLLPGKNYRIEASRDGFKVDGIEISTMNNDQMLFVNNISIEEGKSVAVEDIEVNTPMTNTEVVTNTTTNTTTAGRTYNNPQPTMEVEENESFSSDSGSTGIVNSSPTSTVINNNSTNNNNTYNSPTTTSSTVGTVSEAGVVYKIQLMAVRKYDSSEARFDTPKNYGNLETEYLPNKNLTRVLLSGFATKEEANQILSTMKQNRDFRTAVVVRYENGVRIDPWKK